MIQEVNLLNKKKPVSGTKEWASKNVNFISGCEHNCKYCYAKCIAIRFKRKTPENWHIEEVNMKIVSKRFRKTNGQVMFPSSHDITPKHIDYSIAILDSLLKAGNNVLIVTKPHLEVIQKICNQFPQYKNQILFRFTIGSSNNEILKFWEPNAPTFEERLEALILAASGGFNTSVSCEPALDGNTFELVKQLSPFVTDSIWIGLANRLKGTLNLNGYSDAETLGKAEELKKIQSNKWVYELAGKLENNPKIRWKESIKKILKIERPIESGLDI